MTETVANLFQERLQTSAVGVIVKAEHSCMSMRGIRKQCCMTVTSAMRRSFRTDPASRAELMPLINSADCNLSSSPGANQCGESLPSTVYRNYAEGLRLSQREVQKIDTPVIRYTRADWVADNRRFNCGTVHADIEYAFSR